MKGELTAANSGLPNARKRQGSTLMIIQRSFKCNKQVQRERGEYSPQKVPKTTQVTSLQLSIWFNLHILLSFLRTFKFLIFEQESGCGTCCILDSSDDHKLHQLDHCIDHTLGFELDHNQDLVAGGTVG